MWEDQTDVVTADEVDCTHDIELVLDLLHLGLEGGLDDGPWEGCGGWARHVEWECPDVVKLLCLNSAEDDGIREFTWGSSLSEQADCILQGFGIVDELCKALDGTFCNGVDIIDDNVSECGTVCGGAELRAVAEHDLGPH